MKIVIVKRTCYACKETKSLEEFHVSKNRPNGRQYQCKVCLNAQVKKNNDAKVDPPTEKKCSGCQEFRHISKFYKNKARKDGYDNYCKPCKLEINNERKRMKRL